MKGNGENSLAVHYLVNGMQSAVGMLTVEGSSMYGNPLMFPALGGSVALFFLGRIFARRVSGYRGVIWVLLIVACLPAASFLIYYAHLVDEPWAYIAWRSWPGIELLSACWGLLLGYTSMRLNAGRSTLTGALLLTLLLAFVPFCKPVLRPPHTLSNRWDGCVCLQTSGATCGPAALATIMGYYGLPASETEIARACFASSTGTELWYLLRYARRRGLQVQYSPAKHLADIHAPALIGATPPGKHHGGRSGHFLTLLGKTAQGYRIGDPLVGERVMTERKFAETYGRLRNVIIFHGGNQGMIQRNTKPPAGAEG